MFENFPFNQSKLTNFLWLTTSSTQIKKSFYFSKSIIRTPWRHGLVVSSTLSGSCWSRDRNPARVLGGSLQKFVLVFAHLGKTWSFAFSGLSWVAQLPKRF
jgi:hypothetical protein